MRGLAATNVEAPRDLGGRVEMLVLLIQILPSSNEGLSTRLSGNTPLLLLNNNASYMSIYKKLLKSQKKSKNSIRHWYF